MFQEEKSQKPNFNKSSAAFSKVPMNCEDSTSFCPGWTLKIWTGTSGWTTTLTGTLFKLGYINTLAGRLAINIIPFEDSKKISNKKLKSFESNAETIPTSNNTLR